MLRHQNILWRRRRRRRRRRTQIEVKYDEEPTDRRIATSDRISTPPRPARSANSLQIPKISNSANSTRRLVCCAVLLPTKRTPFRGKGKRRKILPKNRPSHKRNGRSTFFVGSISLSFLLGGSGERGRNSARPIPSYTFTCLSSPSKKWLTIPTSQWKEFGCVYRTALPRTGGGTR